MILEKDIQSLVSKFEERQNNNEKPLEYRLALGECLFDLYELLEKSRDEDNAYLKSMIDNLPSKEIEDYILSKEADVELSRMDAHEQAV